jgi:hypothetical protein
MIVFNTLTILLKGIHITVELTKLSCRLAGAGQTRKEEFRYNQTKYHWSSRHRKSTNCRCNLNAFWDEGITDLPHLDSHSTGGTAPRNSERSRKSGTRGALRTSVSSKKRQRKSTYPGGRGGRVRREEEGQSIFIHMFYFLCLTQKEEKTTYKLQNRRRGSRRYRKNRLQRTNGERGPRKDSDHSRSARQVDTIATGKCLRSWFLIQWPHHFYSHVQYDIGDFTRRLYCQARKATSKTGG